MKNLTALAFILFSGMVLSAQNLSPIPEINQQINNYFSSYPVEKVLVITDKTCYKPGETIWFRSFVTDANNQPAPEESRELFVRIYDKKGNPVLQEKFRLTKGSAAGDLQIPDNLQNDIYFLVAYTSAHYSPEQISCTPLKIDPLYSNQWVAETKAKDSIFISGQRNELVVDVRDISGDLQKNTPLFYQLLNGKEIIEKGKLKTDGNGKAIIPLTIPAKTNGEPFICMVSDTKDKLKHEVFLPSNLDSVMIRFFPEGESFIAGIGAKIGFTAFNKWGLPVDVEGTILDQDGKFVTSFKTLTKGIGLFSLMSDGKQKYKFKISGKTGQNQSFDIPAPKPDGLALSIVKNDAEFIPINLAFADKQKHSIAMTVTHSGNLCWAGDMDIDGIGRIKIPKDNLLQGINLVSVFSKEGSLLAERIVFINRNQQFNIEVHPEKTSLNANESMKIHLRLTDEKNQPVAGNVAISVSDKIFEEADNQKIDDVQMFDSELETPFSLIFGAENGKISNLALFDFFLIDNHIKGFNWDKIRKFNTEKTSNLKSSNSKLVDKSDVKNFEIQLSDFIAANAQKYSLLNNDQLIDGTYFKNNQGLFQKFYKQFKANSVALDIQRAMLSNSSSVLDVIKTIKPYSIKNNLIVFAGSENSFYNQGGALVVVDGIQMGTDISTIQNLAPSDVDHINVSTDPMDIQRYTGLNSVGVIEIFLKSAKNSMEQTAKTQTNNKYEDGYRIPNIFSSELTNPKRDTRTTLVWIPEQKVDESGQFEFSVTAGKVLSDFVINVQGISNQGLAGCGKANFQVVK